VNDVNNVYYKCILDENIEKTEVGDFWCQKCNEIRCSSCPMHGKPIFIFDKPILPKSLASLPHGLRVETVAETGLFSAKDATNLCLLV